MTNLDRSVSVTNQLRRALRKDLKQAGLVPAGYQSYPEPRLKIARAPGLKPKGAN